MNEIVFRKTSNVFLNAGIIGLYIYLDKNKEKYKFKYFLEKEYLKIESDDLFKLLEDVYYQMGKKHYDTSGKKAREEANKYYFIKQPFKAIPFAKMNTYGLAALITNNPTATASKDGQKIKFDKLIEQNYDFAYKIAKELTEKGKKLKFYSFDENEHLFKNSIDEETGKLKENRSGESEIFINSGYTKTPKMSFDEKYFQKGDRACCLTGEKFKKLGNCVNTSPLLPGLNNFESFGESKTRQISWKASYLSKFSPVMCLYMYIDGLDKIVCYLFNSDNLVNTYRLYRKYEDVFLEENEMININYNKNFKLDDFDNQRKNENKKDYSNEFLWPSEILFVLLYTYYRKFLFDQTIEKQGNSKLMLPKLLDEIPTYLTFFRADRFGKKISDPFKPYSFEEFNNYKFIIALFSELEKEGWNSKKIWNWLTSMKVIKESDKKSPNKFRQNERKIRNEILDKILRIESIIFTMKELFYSSYNELTSGTFRYRNYKVLIEFTKFYERIIKYGGNEEMNEEIQEKAIRLGSSIGKSMINFESASKKLEREINIRNGRKYIVSLNKSRTLHQFLSEIKRIQVKYKAIVNEDLLRDLNEENWEYVKNFCIISALNKINIELLPEKTKERGEN